MLRQPSTPPAPEHRPAAPRYSIARWSLSTRLLVLGLAAALACTSLGGWLLREELHAVVLRSFEAQLRERAERVLADIESAQGVATRHPALEQGEFGRIFSGWYWLLRRADGSLLQSRSLWDASLDPGSAHSPRR